MADTPGVVLEPADLNSAVWLKLKAHFEKRLADNRAKNDSPLDPVKTAKLRGRIAEDNYFLSLGSPVPLMKVDAED